MKDSIKLATIGRIKSCRRKFVKQNGNFLIKKGKIKKQCETSKRKNHQGYLCTRLIDFNGVHKTKLIHILVAQAFIPNPLKKETVNHIDGNKHNNNVNNLEWATYSENNKKAIETGLREKYVGFLKNYKKENGNEKVRVCKKNK